MPPREQDIQRSIEELQNLIYRQNVEVGWWDDIETSEDLSKAFPTKLCLIHSEISESMEGHRKNLMDDKLPHREMAEVELADAVIRILDLAGACGYDLSGAIFEKLEYNKNRADHKRENRVKNGGKAY